MPPELEQPEVVEGELLPDVYEPPALPVTLFGSDPRQARDRMVELADVLMELVRSKKLVVNINRGEHLTIEAWTTLGALVGVHAAIVWTRVNESGDGIVARAEARTLAGALVGAAESECSRVERKWKTAEPYAIRSMASTRAMSRALQAPLRHIAVLAGFEGTSAEEMPVDVVEPKPAPAADGPPPLPDAVKPTTPQLDEVRALLELLDRLDPGTDWRARCVEIIGVEGKEMTRGHADLLVRRLRQHADELTREPGPGDGV